MRDRRLEFGADSEIHVAINGKTSSPTFVERVGVELHRAERYRVFLSLTVLDLCPSEDQSCDEVEVGKVLDDLAGQIKEAVRACDYVELLGKGQVAVLLPETRRQEAEIVAHRLADLATEKLGKSSSKNGDNIVPVEIASYPDTAGAKTMTKFLEELAAKSQN